MIYAAETRAEVAANGRLRSPAENGRELCRFWAELTQERRAVYIQKARDDQVFVQKLSQRASSNTASKKRKSRDPSAPRSAMTAYMFYSKAARSRIKDRNPTATFGELGRLIGHEWRELSAGDKKPFEKLAKHDKERYVSAKALYTARQQKAGILPPSKSTKGDKLSKGKRGRPPNARPISNKKNLAKIAVTKALNTAQRTQLQLHRQRGMNQQLLMPKQPPPGLPAGSVMARPLISSVHDKAKKVMPRMPARTIPIMFRPPSGCIDATAPAGKVVMVPPPATRGVSPRGVPPAKTKRKKVTVQKSPVHPHTV